MSNLALVRPIAQSICEKFRRVFELEDLESAGALGLISAAADFDPARGPTFEMYARFRIRGAILDSIKSRELRESRHVSLDSPAISSPSECIARVHGRAAGVEECAGALPAPLKEIIELHYVAGFTLVEVAKRLAIHPSKTKRLHRQAILALRSKLQRPPRALRIGAAP